MDSYDVIVVGSGSGLTAALYAGRQNFKTLVVRKLVGGMGSMVPHGKLSWIRNDTW